jgi:MYND finger
VSYCSAECQHESWKEHKVTYGKKLLLEKELKKFLTGAIHNACSLHVEEKKDKFVSFLKSTLQFAEYQFGHLISGKLTAAEKMVPP